MSEPVEGGKRKTSNIHLYSPCTFFAPSSHLFRTFFAPSSHLLRSVLRSAQMMKTLRSLSSPLSAYSAKFSKMLENGYKFQASEGLRILDSLHTVHTRIVEVDYSLLSSGEEEQEQLKIDQMQNRGCGIVKGPSVLSHLCLDDVSSVLNYDLSLRERYFALLRGVMTQMSETVSGLGRTLDEGVLLSLDVIEIARGVVEELEDELELEGEGEGEGEEDETNSMLEKQIRDAAKNLEKAADFILVEEVGFFRELGSEVYRKQLLGMRILGEVEGEGEEREEEGVGETVVDFKDKQTTKRILKAAETWEGESIVAGWDRHKGWEGGRGGRVVVKVKEINW